MMGFEAYQRSWKIPTDNRGPLRHAPTSRRNDWRTSISKWTAGVQHNPMIEEQSNAKSETADFPIIPVTITRTADIPPPITSTPDLPTSLSYADGVHHDRWTMKFKDAFTRKSYIGDQIEGFYYGISEKGASNPDSFFVCKRKPTKAGLAWGKKMKEMDDCCWRVVRQLLVHRAKHERDCHCDFEWIKSGWTRRDTSRLCEWKQGKTGRWVLEAMKSHDRKCCCGAFDFPNSRAVATGQREEKLAN